MFLIGAYLLYLCDSKTSILCLILGGGILTAARLPWLRQRVGALGIFMLGTMLCFFAVDAVFGIKGALLGVLGRDATLTGRTDVWRELLALKTDPLFGLGFCSIWSDEDLLSRLPDWVGKSAHNGYIEMYIDGGYVAVFFLLLMLLAIGVRLNRELASGENYALIRFAVFAAAVIGDISESHWARMGPLWFMFLLTAIGSARTAEAWLPVRRQMRDPDDPLSSGMKDREPVTP
jgi:O-antigen ligase